MSSSECGLSLRSNSSAHDFERLLNDLMAIIEGAEYNGRMNIERIEKKSLLYSFS